MNNICVVIPAYKASKTIVEVVKSIPDFVAQIIVVDDGCPEGSGNIVERECTDAKIRTIFHKKNIGVGGAMKTGFTEALKTDCSVIVKVDSDGQMDTQQIEKLAQPILSGRVDYTKANRFYSMESLAEMPIARVIGNAFLSFLSKLSSGYWQLMDPTNGFVAIHRKALELIPLEKLDLRFFFESDMLFRLNLINAMVIDVPMPSRYREEKSNINIVRIIFPFLWSHCSRLFKRLVYRYFLSDFNAGSLSLVFGTLLTSFGCIYGSYHYLANLATDQPTPTGTIVVTAIAVITGINFLLSFLNYDIAQQPRNAVHPLL